MENEFLANVKKDGEDPFAQYDKEETPSESQPENIEEVSVPEETTETEENTPYHLRWREREEKLKAEFQEEFETYKRELDEKVQNIEPRTESTNIPDWFSELYGANEIAWQKYEAHEKQKEQEITQKVLSHQEEQKRAQQEEVKKWDKWVDTQVKQLQSEGLKFDRNELIKTVLDYRPTDENNNFDFHAAYKIMEAVNAKDPAISQARKQLADTMTSSSRGEPAKKDYMTSQQLRNLSWGSL